MDRNQKTNFLVLPLVYFFSLSIGLILLAGYLLASSGRGATFANENDTPIQVELSKNVDSTIEVARP